MRAALRYFFYINSELVIFAGGLVFFVLGLAIALQTRRQSRLELARSLGWLTIFGITHGLHEWGNLFIPVQATYMNHAGSSLLQVFQVLLLGVSFWALFQFGADLLQDRWPRIRYLPGLVTAGWLLYLLVMGLQDIEVGIWQQLASIWARYVLCLPGGLMAAYGLRHQARRQIEPLGLNYIYQVLQVGGLTIAAYTLLSGLITPYAPFFPANVLNPTLIDQLLGIPVTVLRAVAGLLMTLTISRAMEVFDVEIERLIESMEIEQSLTAERERIGRELHDGAIQQAYSAGLIIESARHKLDDDSIAAQRLDRAIQALNETIVSLRAYMGELRSQPVATSLIEGLRELTADPALNALMDIELQTDPAEPTHLNPIQTMHILALAREALSNAARHAKARHAVVELARTGDRLALTIRDDGCGFDYTEQSDGYGLRNMRDRARLLNGDLHIDSAPGRGTAIKLQMPYRD